MIRSDEKPLVIGVTGNIGSGKTTVSRILEKYGAYVINADKIAKEVLLKGGPGYKDTLEFFGEGILQENGEIDRKKLGDIVFSDKEKLIVLNGTTHKHVLRKIDEEINKIRQEKSHRIVCLDVPLLFESGLDEVCDVTWVVDAAEEVKLRRVMERDKMDLEAARARLKSQTPSDVIRQKADRVIDNDAGYDELEVLIVEEIAAGASPHWDT